VLYLNLIFQGYVLSWDLIKRLSIDRYCYIHKKDLHEDALIASCLTNQGLVNLSQPLNVTRIYDDPRSNAPWAHDYINDTLFIHQLKNDDSFLKACYHFMKMEYPFLKGFGKRRLKSRRNKFIY
jgi:hypothetical protein